MEGGVVLEFFFFGKFYRCRVNMVSWTLFYLVIEWFFFF